MRCLIVSAFMTVLLFLAGCTEKPKEKTAWSIGVIQYTNVSGKILEGFKSELAVMGYVEGVNLRYIHHGTASGPQETDHILTRIISEKPDLILSTTTPITQKAYIMTRDKGIPVVFAPVNDPLEAGLMRNMLKPGENITGVRLSPGDPKRLQWLKSLKTSVSHVLVPYSPGDKSSVLSVSSIQDTAEKLGIRLTAVPVHNPKELISLVQNLTEDYDAVFLPRDGLLASTSDILAEICIEKKLILSVSSHDRVKGGATTGYGFVGYEIGRQAARIASSILKGLNPGDIPVETTENYFFLNTETAKKIGLQISDRMIRNAYKD